jgi:hypothetical protein
MIPSVFSTILVGGPMVFQIFPRVFFATLNGCSTDSKVYRKFCQDAIGFVLSAKIGLEVVELSIHFRLVEPGNLSVKEMG